MKKNNNTTIKDFPVNDRPYEKCERFGEATLTDAELLAVIIKNGYSGRTSTELAFDILCLNEGAGLINLFDMSLEELKKIKGVGRVKAIQLKCIAELSKRIARIDKGFGKDFSSPMSVAEYFMQEMRFLDREHLFLVMLDSRSRLIKYTVISSGTVNSSVASTREVFVQAVKHNAVTIILLHNHPSGDPTPSSEDLYVTTKMKEAGEIVGIPLLDHIIIGDNNYYSMNEAGYI